MEIRIFALIIILSVFYFLPPGINPAYGETPAVTPETSEVAPVVNEEELGKSLSAIETIFSAQSRSCKTT